jgi:hypothetical protein
MNDEILARASALVGVVVAGVDERLLDAVTVDGECGLAGMLLDDREQVGEQAPLEVGEFRLQFRCFDRLRNR